jgi:hypothetical protein
MLKKSFVLAFLLAVLALAMLELGRAQEERRMPANKELVSKAQSVYVQSDTFYMKRENLQSSLLGRAEFKAWDIQITGKPQLADLLIRVRRVPFTNHFTYTVTDRATDTIVMAGKVDSLAGTVYGLIADEIVHKMKVFRGDPLAVKPGQTAQATPTP